MSKLITQIRRNIQELNARIDMTDWTNYLLKPENITDTFRLNNIAISLADLLDANIYIVNMDGDIHGFYESYKVNTGRVYDIVKRKELPFNYLNRINAIEEVLANIPITDDRTIFPVEKRAVYEKALTTIIPITLSGKRIGTMIVANLEKELLEADIVAAEYAASLVAITVNLKQEAEKILDQNVKEQAELTYDTLSNTERRAIRGIYDALGDEIEMRVVTSEIADELGITRSVIVSSLQKLVIAKIIDQRSMGMRGTYIKILNPYFETLLEKTE